MTALIAKDKEPFASGERPEATADPKAEAVAAVERELHAQRRSVAMGLAGARELRWMAIFCLVLSVPVLAGPYVLQSHHATLVCYYGAIIAFVVSGWGVIRASLAARRGQAVFRFVGMLYAAFFLFLTLLYGALMLSSTLDKRWIFLWSPMPGKPVYAPNSLRRK
jgi:hypothetical protein